MNLNNKRVLLQNFSEHFSGNKRKYTVMTCVLIVAFATYKYFHKNKTIADFPLPPVLVTEAKFGPVLKYINAIGTLHPHNSVMLKSEVNSVVTKIHFKEGTIVKEGDLLIELDDANARASLLEAQAQYQRAVSEYEPTEKLADKGVMAKIERDKRKAEVDICAAKVASSKNYLEKHKILAPFGGLVGLKEVNIGQYVAPGNDLVKIVDCYPLNVDFKVAESEIRSIYVGQDVKILVGGDDLQEYQGKIVAIDPESEKISHSFNVRALLDVPEDVVLNSRTLKAGTFVSVKIVPDENNNGILIPESCLEKVGDDYYVYKIVDGTAVRTIVTIGMRKNDAVEIITGIDEGDIVVSSGQQGVLDGHGVDIQKPEVTAPLSSIIDQAKEISKKRREAAKK